MKNNTLYFYESIYKDFMFFELGFISGLEVIFSVQKVYVRLYPKTRQMTPINFRKIQL